MVCLRSFLTFRILRFIVYFSVGQREREVLFWIDVPQINAYVDSRTILPSIPKASNDKACSHEFRCAELSRDLRIFSTNINTRWPFHGTFRPHGVFRSRSKKFLLFQSTDWSHCKSNLTFITSSNCLYFTSCYVLYISF